MCSDVGRLNGWTKTEVMKFPVFSYRFSTGFNSKNCLIYRGEMKKLTKVCNVL